MDDSIQTLKDDIAFMKAMAEDSGRTLARDGAIMIVVGVIFGLDALRFWGIDAGYLDWAKASENWMGLDALAIFLVVLPIVLRRFRISQKGAASRAISAAWTSVGWAFGIAVLALSAGAWRLHQPRLVVWVLPLILFTLYGAAWCVAFTVKRHPWLAGIAAGSFATVLASGIWMGRPGEWAILALGLFLWVAAPGVAIIHQARASS